ncbi:MAG: biotin--[acetyl-CoA-carboxylase] ligase [Acutalibacteraceae bacterium]|nr:biotin--[acetyl-CoA-carboxylase] ligase [Acutalibacteraceae bacterium]
MSTKNRVLELLEQKRGESISGEHLAGILGISRNAVWKSIKELQKDGYNIFAVTNKGYCLSDENDIVSIPGIKPFLSLQSQPYADKIHIFKSLESTNKTAKEMAVAGAEHGTVIISDSQTMGRGRYSRNFFSPFGGLYMSIILRPEVLHFDNPTSVTAFAAVSVCQAIESISKKSPKIKWVNDIFIDGKKVCGILTEAVTDFESGGLDWIVLGIGINVYTRTEEFPVDLQSLATSIFPDEKMPGMRNKLSAEIINRILGFETLPRETEIFEKYKKRLLILGKEITVIQNNTEYRATAIDVNSKGNLIVKNENGEVITLSSGEIRI